MSHDPLDLTEQDNASDDQIAAAERRAQIEADDIRWLMSDKRGRRIVWRQLEKTGIYRLSHTGNALQTSFNEGTRSVGLELLASIMAVAPASYAKMAEEASSK